MIEIRFKLYDSPDARLISRIIEQAAGDSLNNAARFLMLHWLEIERQSISPQVGQPSPPQLGRNTAESDEDADLVTALDSLVEDFSGSNGETQ